MRIDSMEAYQAGQKSEQKARPEVRAVKRSESAAGASQRAVRFQKHQSANRWMVQVVDLGSDEVIREIPDQKRLDMAAAMLNMIGKLQDSRC